MIEKLKKSLKKWVIPSSIIILLCLFLSLFLISIALFVLRKKNDESYYDDVKFSSFGFQSFSITGENHNETTRKKIQSSSGLVTLPENIMHSEEFITFSSHASSDHDSSRIFIISKLDSTITDHYTCTGSCYCETKTTNNRKTSFTGGKLLKSGVFVLISAVSSIIALKNAEIHLHQKCLELINDRGGSENVCFVENVKSTVDECVDINTMTESFDDNETQERDNSKKLQFLCKGKCVENEEIYEIPAVNLGDLKSGYPNCEEMEMVNTIWTEVEEEDDKLKMMKMVKKKFVEKYLDPYCLENSSVELRMLKNFKNCPKFKNWGTSTSGGWTIFPFCNGGDVNNVGGGGGGRKRKFGKVHNPTVVCKKNQ